MEISKDQSSTPEAEQITSPTTTDRQCSLANSTRLDNITSVCATKRLHFERKQMKTGPNFAPKLQKHLYLPLAYYHMQYLVLPKPVRTSARDERDA